MIIGYELFYNAILVILSSMQELTIKFSCPGVFLITYIYGGNVFAIPFATRKKIKKNPFENLSNLKKKKKKFSINKTEQ